MKKNNNLFGSLLRQLVPTDLSLQAKILKYTCLVVIGSGLAGAAVNFSLGFPIEINLVIFLFVLGVVTLFVKMPVDKNFNATSSILLAFCLGTFCINWFPNGGVHTSSPHFFLLLIGFAAVSLTGRALWWNITLCVVVFITLVGLEIILPSLPAPIAPNSWQVKMDIIFSISSLSYLMAWLISTILKTNQKRYEQVEEASQAKSLFLSQLSHELRTPLNAVIGFSNLMLKQGELPLAQKKYLESINVNGFHLLALVNQVMDLSMIEAGKIELHWQAVDLVKLLKEIEDVVSIQAAEKGLQYSSVVNIDKKKQKHLVIHSDPNRLRQILVNLINNAIKYTDKGSVTCILRNSNKNILFEVEDTGSGIPEDKQQTIFEPLFRLEKHHQKEGKGMGLSITRSLCEHLGYRLELESSSPEGSVFQLLIPHTRHRP